MAAYLTSKVVWGPNPTNGDIAPKRCQKCHAPGQLNDSLRCAAAHNNNNGQSVILARNVIGTYEIFKSRPRLNNLCSLISPEPRYAVNPIFSYEIHQP